MTKLANCDLGLGRVLVWKHSEDMRQWVTMLFVRIGIVFLTPTKTFYEELHCALSVFQISRGSLGPRTQCVQHGSSPEVEA